MKRLTEFSFQNGSPITLIIGSGVNQHATGRRDGILSNWGSMLGSIFKDCKFDSRSNYILEFERCLVRLTSKQKFKEASKIERLKIKALAGEIRKSQADFLDQLSYPCFLLDSQKVANVISLNFDLIPELLLNNRKVPKLKFGESKNSRRLGFNTNRVREIKGINFWHPHGDCANYSTMVLGFRQYGKQMKCLEDMRNFSKSNRNKSEVPQPQNWYEALTHAQILVLGASLSKNEIDLWGALVNRERNFAKKDNRNQYRKRIFIMWSHKESGCFDMPDWIEPLFPTSHDYNSQWSMLKELFDRPIK
jgi:hypothetical protein